MSPTVVAFLHFLYWASHFLWLGFAPDQNDLGNHVIYGGNVLDCIAVTQHLPALHASFGDAASVANHCIASNG